MGFNAFRVELYKRAGYDWNMTYGAVLNTARDLKIELGAQAAKDTFSLKLDNGKLFFDGLNSQITPDIEEQDLVRVFGKKDFTTGYTFTNSDILFEGTVNTGNQQLSDSGDILSVEGFNWFEVFFNVSIPAGGTNYTNKNCMEMLRTLVTVDLKHSGIDITWDPLNPATKTDGTSFPLKTLATNYTPTFMIIEKLASNDYTADGQYVYYIGQGSDGKRQFSIRPQKTTPETTVITDLLPIESVSIERGKDNVKNYIIYNCGTDLYGQSVEWYTYDATSIGRYGWNTYYAIDETGQMFTSVLNNEIRAKKSSFTFDSNGNLTSSFPSSYPYVFAADGTSVANANDYNNQLRTLALAQGFERAQALITQVNKAYYNVSITMPFRTDFLLGGLYNIQLTKVRSFSNQLRLRYITYTTTQAVFTFDQDIKDRTYTLN
jgi:hypothetical protein